MSKRSFFYVLRKVEISKRLSPVGSLDTARTPNIPGEGSYVVGKASPAGTVKLCSDIEYKHTHIHECQQGNHVVM